MIRAAIEIKKAPLWHDRQQMNFEYYTKFTAHKTAELEREIVAIILSFFKMCGRQLLAGDKYLTTAIGLTNTMLDDWERQPNDPKMNIVEPCSKLNSMRGGAGDSFKGFMAHFADTIIEKLEKANFPCTRVLGLTFNGKADDSYRPSEGEVTGLIYMNREKLRASEKRFIENREKLRDEMAAADALGITPRADADDEMMDIEKSPGANTSAESSSASRTGRQ